MTAYFTLVVITLFSTVTNFGAVESLSLSRNTAQNTHITPRGFVTLRLKAGFGKDSLEREASGPYAHLPEDDVKCFCASEKSYIDCCKPKHMESSVRSSASDLIRARFSAYATANTDFIIATTSDQSPDFEYYSSMPGNQEKTFRRWNKDIKNSMTDEYAYVRMEILSETNDKECADVATVVFRQLAVRKTDNVMYPIEEKSTCIKNEDGEWEYVLGEVTRPEPEVGQTMMQTWPDLAGMKMTPLTDLDDGFANADAVVGGQNRGQMGPTKSNPLGGAFGKGAAIGPGPKGKGSSILGRDSAQRST